MRCPLIIAGEWIERAPLEAGSPFFEKYRYRLANAGMLDISAAIGRARKANRGTLQGREIALRLAGEAFTYDSSDLEHTVRLTGMPIRVAKSLLDEIPQWLQDVPRFLSKRFSRLAGEESLDVEKLTPHLSKLMNPGEGFCYAVTPANDPRSAALVAANLGYLGIPFVMRASKKDAVAPLVIQALLAGGFDPSFCSLLYFDGPQSAQKHFKLVDASAIVWTFGPRELVDSHLRYETLGNRIILDLPGEMERPDPEEIKRMLVGRKFRTQSAQHDHFEGKIILRHEAGNCAALTYGPLNEATKTVLNQAISFPLGCMATKSVIVVEGENWVEKAADFLAELKTGDPLEEGTEIGYIDSQILDHLERLVPKYRLKARFWGGERLSPIQARPLLVASQEPLANFFAQEIPAYVLAVQTCPSIEAGIERINHYSGKQPRLAVSLHNLPERQLNQAISRVHAWTILVNQPTTRVIPFFHEGNDYALSLRQGRILVS